MMKKITFLLIAQLIFSTFSFANSDTVKVQKGNFEYTSEMIHNVVANEGEESAEIAWSLDHDLYAHLKARNAKLIITYNTKLGKERLKENLTGSDWMFTEPFDLDDIKYKIEDLIGNENYLFKVGFTTEGSLKENKKNKEKMIWSEEAKCKPERGWGIAKLLILIGSLGFFIYGMKIMSEGLQQAAGSKLRSMLGSITSNRFKGVLTGFGITSIVQSSSVTTVMTVSFVNAGLMTLRQSAGVMMGANIGTTITAWLVLLLGFKVSISSYAFMIIALATPLLFIQKGKSKAWASAIFGFCILFIGLDELKDAVPVLDASSAIVQFFIDFKGAWYGPVMFVMLGALVTVIIQSSSAAMALTLAMVAAGTIPFEVACAMVLGENIGTTVTAEIASLIANVHAKRSARIHSMFNIIGVTWMLLIFPFFLKMIGYIVGGDNFDPTDIVMAGSGIALFHTLFNAANVVVLIGFVPQLVRLAEHTVKSKGESDEEFKLDYIDGPLGSTAELCILEATKEVAKFGKITAKMNVFVRNYINTSDKKIRAKMLKKIAKYEEITDRVEVEVGDYLGKTSRLEMSDEASRQMRGMLNISTDLERIGDIFYQMSKALEKKDHDKQYFTPEQRKGINKMIDATEKAFDVMNDNLRAEYGTISMDKAKACEKVINKLRDELREQHLTHFESGDINMNSALIYSNIFSSFEKVGDHIINVSEAVAGENIN
jgi:phosphate:Na+ symporter